MPHLLAQIHRAGRVAVGVHGARDLLAGSAVLDAVVVEDGFQQGSGLLGVHAAAQCSAAESVMPK